MRSHNVRIGLAGLSIATLVACNDGTKRDLLAPHSPDKSFLYPGGGIVLLQPNPNDFVEITAGSSHTCARKNSGDVYCWGTDAGTARTPVRVFSGATQIEAGGSHTCALISGGAAYCWGHGAFGELGTVPYSPDFTSGPLPVLGPSNGTPLAFTAISAGPWSTCGTTTAATYCWGILGNPRDATFGAVFPTMIKTWRSDPSQESSYGDYYSLTVGKLHTCAIYRIGGQPACWSAVNGDTYGQAGSDPAIWASVKGMVLFDAGTELVGGVSRLSTNQDFTCADMTSGVVQCFGYNADGELGDGTFKSTWMPQTVGGNMQLHGVAAGYGHACALDASNHAVCWGSDGRGQLGNGQKAGLIYLAPQQVGPVSTDFVAGTFGSTVAFRAVAAGGGHTCGIGTDNHIYCWGDNRLRQLGRDVIAIDGSFATFTTSPVQTM